MRLSLHNSLGQTVRVLVDEYRAAGRFEEIWDGNDDRGRPAASGVYLYLLEVEGKFTDSRKLTLLE